MSSLPLLLDPQPVAQAPEGWPLRPHSLVSLLDMLKFDAEPFCTGLGLLAQMLIQLREGKFPTKNNWGYLGSAMGEIQRQCEYLNLRVSLILVLRIRDSLEGKEELNYQTLHQNLMDLYTRLIDEISTYQFYALSPGAADFFEKQQFSDRVVQRFTRAMDDMIEAGRCYALDRYTACVFHLMRVTEAGLYALGAFVLPSEFDENDPAPVSWNKLIGKIDRLIKSPQSEWPLHLANRYALLSDLSAQMHAVNKAWRNDTMHLKNIYTSEMALDILNATKGLMRHLAENLPS